jgi:hypothetical protein
VSESAARHYPRTWRHGDGWHPLFVGQLTCGCWQDGIDLRIWEPCMAHEGEGHLSALSDADDGTTIARCLVLDCRWVTTRADGMDAVRAAQDHWASTRAETGH